MFIKKSLMTLIFSENLQKACFRAKWGIFGHTAQKKKAYIVLSVQYRLNLSQN